MVFRYAGLLMLALLALTPSGAQANNAGFVDGLWFQREPVFAAVDNRIYVAIRNNTGSDLTGTVTFYVGEERIGSQSVSALSNRLIESWIDWTPQYGEQTIRAELSRVTLSTATSSSRAELPVAATRETRFIDYDTDGDGVGNSDDADDDGDGYADTEEAAANTDPLDRSEKPAPTAGTGAGDTAEDSTVSPETNTPTSRVTEGLERYLTPSRADTLLTTVTTWATTTKAKLDTFRADRASELLGTSTPITVDENGFGPVTRSTDPVTPSPTDGFVADIVRLIGQALHGVLSVALFLLSSALGHPALLQLALLFLILIGGYTLARKLGARPVVKKK